MPLYQCELCEYDTKIKTQFNRHLNTSKHHKNSLNNSKFKDHDSIVNPLNHTIPKIKSDTEQLPEKKVGINYNCELCGRELSTKGHLTRHIRDYCPESKSKKESTILKDLLEAQKQQFADERANLYKQIEKLLDKVGNTTNIQSNIKNTINLNSYGNENMSHITDQLKTQLVKIPYGMIPKLIEAVHFNDEHPENKNIALTNSRDNKIKVYSDNKWVYKDKEETINDLVDGKYYILDAHYEQVNDSLASDSRTNFVKFKAYFNTEDKEFVNRLKKDCELVLLNNR
jgi:hypothetical protein